MTTSSRSAGAVVAAGTVVSVLPVGEPSRAALIIAHQPIRIAITAVFPSACPMSGTGRTILHAGPRRASRLAMRIGGGFRHFRGGTPLAAPAPILADRSGRW